MESLGLLVQLVFEGTLALLDYQLVDLVLMG